MTDAGTSFLSINGDRQEALAYLPAAQKQLRLLQDRLRLGGIQVGAQYFRLSDTAYGYVRIAGEMNIIGITADSSEKNKQPKPLTFTTEKFPSIMSGAVQIGYFQYDDDNKDRPYILKNYWPTSCTQQIYNLGAGSQLSERLSVLPYDGIPTAKPLPSGRPRPQFAGLRPTMYTGRMKRVVQALLGIGKLPEEGVYPQKTKVDLPAQDGVVPPNKLPPKPASPYEQEVRQMGYQVRYDFRWFRSHGITKDAAGKDWLVEIGGTRGALAMRLPLIPNSTSPEFRDKAMKLRSLGGSRVVTDEAVLKCLDEFGGIPSGELFPQNPADIEAMVRAGTIIRLLTSAQLERFYSGRSPYSSACGWAFSEHGREAHNTCYKEALVVGQAQIGEHHKINIQIGAEPEEFSRAFAERMRAVLSPFRDEYGHYRFEAVISKLARMTPTEAREHGAELARVGEKAFFAQVDAMDMSQLQTFISNIGLAGSGKLYGKGITAAWQMKFWEPEWEYENAVISHDFAAPNPVSCNTTVFVYFKGNDLKYVRHFYTTKSNPDVEVKDNYETCMNSGEWEKTADKGRNSVRVGYYSTDHDGRKEYSAQPDLEQITATPIGWTALIASDYLGYFSDNGTGNCTRSRIIQKLVYAEKNATKSSLSAVICMPAGLREGVFFATEELESASTKTWTYTRYSQPDRWTLGDPNPGSNPRHGYASYYTYGTLPYGSPGYKIVRVFRKPDPRPEEVLGNPCWTDFTEGAIWEEGQMLGDVGQLEPGQTPDWMANGVGYLGPVPGYEATPLEPQPANVVETTPSKGMLKIYFDYFGGKGADRTVTTNSDSPNPGYDAERLRWFECSPEGVTPSGIPIGYSMSQWATANALGAMPAVIYQQRPDGAVVMKGTERDELKANPCFLGVVNE